MQVVGTLAGLLGLGMLFAIPVMLTHGIKTTSWWMLPIMSFPLVVAVYLIYVGYLALFRFSPVTVRHICGALAFGAITLIVPVFDSKENADNAWMPFAFIGCLAVAYLGYRAATSWFCKLLFQQKPTDAAS